MKQNCSDEIQNENKNKQPIIQKKKDFEQYMIDKFQALKLLLNESLQQNSLRDSSSLRLLTNRSHTKKLNSRNDNLQQNIPNIIEETSKYLNSNEVSILNKKMSFDGSSKKINYSLYYVNLDDQFNKLGIKVNRYNERLNKLVEIPQISTKNNQIIPNSHNSSNNTSIIRKKSYSNSNIRGITFPDESILGELKTNSSTFQQKSAEENLKNVLQKKILKEMQAESQKKENFYDRIKNYPVNIEQCLILRKRQISVDLIQTDRKFDQINHQKRQKIPQLNLNYRSQSNNSRYTEVSSTQQNDDYIKKFTKLSQKTSREEIELPNLLKNNINQNVYLPLLNTSIDEIKAKDQDEQNQNEQELINDLKPDEIQQENDTKFIDENSILNNSLRVFIENEQQENDNQYQLKNILSIPYQRQWVISSPLSRQSPFFSHKLPEIKKQKIDLNHKLQKFDFSQKMKKQLNVQNFTRNPSFDIHFSSFEHQRLQKNKLKEKEQGQSNNTGENSKTQVDEDLSHFKKKRKASIFHQDNVVILNKDSLKQSLSGSATSRNTNSLPTIYHRNIKGKQVNEDQNKRYIKPYKKFVRNKDDDSQEGLMNKSEEEKTPPQSNKIYDNIFEKDFLECEENHSLNEQLIEGLEHNIDRFISSLKNKILNNKSLDQEIKQECYIFDFEQFISNIRTFILASISKKPLGGNTNQFLHSFARNSILFEGISTSLPASFRLSLLGTPKYDIREIFFQLLNTKFGVKVQNENEQTITSQVKRSQYLKNQQTHKTESDIDIPITASLSTVRADSQQALQIQNTSSITSPKFANLKVQVPIIPSLTDKIDSLSFLKRQNSITAVSPRLANIKGHIKQNSQFSKEKSNQYESNSFSDQINQTRRQSIKNNMNVSFSEQYNQSQFASAAPSQRETIRTLKSLKEEHSQDEKDITSKMQFKGKHQGIPLNESIDEAAKEKAFMVQRQAENKKKEEETFQQYMQFGLNEIENYSKNNVKLTPSVFDQLLSTIMEILLEFQYSNLSINQYIGSLQKRAETLVVDTVKNDLQQALYDKLITTTVSKMELQSKMSSSITKFLHALFEVEEDLIRKRFLVDSFNDKKSQKMLDMIYEAVAQCQLNYLQFYSLKLFLYETMKDMQTNFKTIEKALSLIESFRNEICCNQNTFRVQSEISQNQKQFQNPYDDDEENINFRQEEYVINLSSKSSMRKLIDEFEWVLQIEMVEFMNCDSKLNHELQLFISDLIFCLVRIYPAQQIALHKNLKILSKSFYDQVILYFCQLLFKKKMPIEVIRNVQVQSYKLETYFNFQSRLMNQMGGFNKILALSFIFSSVHYMDKYKAKCSVSSNVSLINVVKQLDNNMSSQKPEEDNTQLIVLTIQNYQLTWMEYLFACYFSPSLCYNTYDLKAAITINKIDKLTLQKWIEYLAKLGQYFDDKCLKKFSQELQISLSFIK